MRFWVVVLTSSALCGCAGESANPNRANSVSDTRAGQSPQTGPPRDNVASPGETLEAVTIRLNAEPQATFDVVGLTHEELERFGNSTESAAWSELFSIRVLDQTTDWQAQPAVLGKYSVEADVLRFKPAFPLVPGVTYRALLNADQLTHGTSAQTSKVAADAGNPATLVRDFSIPKVASDSATFVSHVFPSANTLPENQLKFYLHFSAPMSRGEAYRRVHLVDESGSELTLPFLELDEELWDPQGRRITLFIDPGRIKRGLQPREEVGPVFEEGKAYTLVIDRAWHDWQGNELQQEFRKEIHIGPADDKQPDPNDWTIHAPARGTMEPLLVDFPEPMDHGMLQRVIVVRDSENRLVAGDITIDKNETRWALTPHAAWPEGDYALEVQTDLEDLAGNSIARVFDVDVLEPISRSIKAERWSVPFYVR